MEPTMGGDWAAFGPDLTDLILSRLPIRSLVVAAAVCKMWRSVVTHPSFARRLCRAHSNPDTYHHHHHHPWFFLSAHNNVLPLSNQTFAFDPDAAQWLRIPTPPSDSSFFGAAGFFFTTTSGFSYAPALTSLWRHTPPLKFSRCDPLVGVYSSGDGDCDCDGGGGIKFVVVGGVRFFGGLVDIEDQLAVEIYDPARGEWEVAPPLPGEFRLGNSSHWLSSAIFRRRFFVRGIYSGVVSAFDVAAREWSPAVTLRPPDVLFSFLLPCRPHLVLAGLCSAPAGPSFVLWQVDDRTMECTQIAAMPGELLRRMFEVDEDEGFASLKCVGMGELVYVFNEAPHRMYPACVCEIGRCRWWMLPELPPPVNRFHKVTSFCSTVPLAPLFLPS